MTHGMNVLRSVRHEIFGMHENKTLLSAFDSKRWIADDGINTNTFRYNPPLALTEAEKEALWDFINEAFGV